MDYIGSPHIINIPLTLANTEYSVVIPVNARSVRLHNRPAAATIRYSYDQGYVAAGTDKCSILSAGEDRVYDYCFMLDTTIYFAAGTTGETAEVEYWL